MQPVSEIQGHHVILMKRMKECLRMESLKIKFLRRITFGLRAIRDDFIINQERKFCITWNVIGYSA